MRCFIFSKCMFSKPLGETKPQITKSKPQVRTKENHADYSMIEPYICTVEYAGNGMCLR